MTDKPWTYSHTQLKMFRRCKRLYHDVYMLGYKEPTTPNMAFGTLVHTAIETWLYDKWLHYAPGEAVLVDDPTKVKLLDWEIIWQRLYANFLADCDETDSYDDPIFNLKTAKRCLDLYRKHPIEGDIKGVEKPDVYTFPTGHRYSSRPDFVVEQLDGEPPWHRYLRKTVDLKFQKKQFNHRPLLPFDDQLLGQAIVHQADAFIRYAFVYDPKTGRVDGPPLVEEQPVDPVLRDEWIGETLATILEIESWKQRTGATWTKDDDSCFDFGRECHRLKACRNGATSTPLVKHI